MLKLTSLMGRSLYVRPALVAAICGQPDGEGKPDMCGVFLQTGTSFLVRDDVDEIARQLRCEDGEGWKNEYAD